MWRNFVWPVDNRERTRYNKEVDTRLGATRFRHDEIGNTRARRIPVGLLKKLEKS